MSLPTAFVSERGAFPYRFAEAFLALGPQSIGVTGDNTLSDLIGRVWLLVLTSGRELHLYQRAADAPSWSRVTGLLPPVFGEVQPAGRRRFSIAFDQSSRATVAYEESGTIYLTRWDTTANGGLGGYVQNVTVVGVDPVVVFDATWAYNVTNSDVLLFYLSADRSRFLSRVQRDIYGTEYELHDYGQPVILDRVSRLPLQYQALVSDVVGNPLMVDGERVGLLSNLYPYLANDALSASLASALPGFYEPMVLRFTPNEYLVTEGSALSGTYEPAVEYAYIEEPNPLLAGFLSALDGAYEVVVSRTSASEEPFTASFVQSIPGAYVFAVFRYTGDENAANITASALDGSYML